MTRLCVVLVCVACAAPAPDVDRPGTETLSTARVVVLVRSRRIDKPGTLGETYYTVTAHGLDRCLETFEPLAATWSGVPMLLLSHGKLETNQTCTVLELAIARADMPATDPAIEISDPNGTVSARYSSTIFDTGTTVPASDTWELQAGTVARFTWSVALTGIRDPELCFLPTAGVSSSCAKGSYDSATHELAFPLPSSPVIPSDGVALLKNVAVIEGGTLGCSAVGCSAAITVELEHPARMTVP